MAGFSLAKLLNKRLCIARQGEVVSLRHNSHTGGRPVKLYLGEGLRPCRGYRGDASRDQNTDFKCQLERRCCLNSGWARLLDCVHQLASRMA